MVDSCLSSDVMLHMHAGATVLSNDCRYLQPKVGTAKQTEESDIDRWWAVPGWIPVKVPDHHLVLKHFAFP